MENVVKKDKKEYTLSNKDNIFKKLTCISCKKQIEINIDHKCEYRSVNNILIKTLK